MHRTTIMLPEKLKSRVVRESRALGLSLGEYVRVALEASLDASRAADSADDALLEDTTSYVGKAPTDAAGHHDDYLYAEST